MLVTCNLLIRRCARMCPNDIKSIEADFDGSLAVQLALILAASVPLLMLPMVLLLLHTTP